MYQRVVGLVPPEGTARTTVWYGVYHGVKYLGTRIPFIISMLPVLFFPTGLICVNSICHDTYSKLYETFGTMVYRVTLYLCTVNKSDYYH